MMFFLFFRPDKEVKKSYKMEDSENEDVKDTNSKEKENDFSIKNVFRCQEPDCEKVFKSGNSLKLHTKSHFGGKKLSCPECGKMFTQQSHLTVHIRVNKIRLFRFLRTFRPNYDNKDCLITFVKYNSVK
jgi:uncharacterized C2H2 Zn-finger protein